MTHPITFSLVLIAAGTSAAAALSGSLPLAIGFAGLALGLMQSWRLARGARRLLHARRRASGHDRDVAPIVQRARLAVPASNRAGFSTLVDGGGPEATLTFLPTMRAGLARSVVERPGD